MNDRAQLMAAMTDLETKEIARATPGPGLDCGACPGWFVNPPPRHEIHRCDTCNVFDDDYAAAERAVELLMNDCAVPVLFGTCDDPGCSLCLIRIIYPEYLTEGSDL